MASNPFKVWLFLFALALGTSVASGAAPQIDSAAALAGKALGEAAKTGKPDLPDCAGSTARPGDRKSEGDPKAIFDAIQKLKEGGRLPSGWVTSTSSRWIASAIVARIHGNRDPDDPGADGYDFKKNSAIQMAFSEVNIDPIQTGCFKNRHQLGGGPGEGYTKARIEVEDSMAGLALGAANEVRPKYAFLGLKVPDPNIKAHPLPSDCEDGYGNVIAVFKEEVKSRSTFTPYDSYPPPPGMANLHTFSFRPKGALNFEPRSYWEAQIWGKLCFEDVDHFMINCVRPECKDPEKHRSGPVSEKAVAKLLATGVPVFECAGDLESGFGYKEGNQLKGPDEPR